MGVRTVLLFALAIAVWSPVVARAQEPPPPAPKGDAPRDPGDPSFPGSWAIFGTNTRMKIGGYVKADFLYDFDGTLDRKQFLMSTIPVEGTPEHANSGYVSFFANETRFNIDVRHTEPEKPAVKVFMEGDLWPAGQFRLRHAYIQYGNLTGGQTWTTLSILESLPSLIDFAAGDALFGGRTTQIRYQWQLNARWKVATAVESLDFMGIENPNNLAGEPSAAMPLLVVRVDRTWKSGMLAFGSSVGQLRWDGGATGPDATALQVDGVFAGRQNLGPSDTFLWNLSAGKGSGENIMAFTGSLANAVLTEDGHLDTIPAYALVLSLIHEWSVDLTSNASVAYGWLDTPETRDDFALLRGGVAHVNVIWHPTETFSTGVEYIWGVQRTTNLAFGRASRIQWMMKAQF
jgi:hypothetical protein